MKEDRWVIEATSAVDCKTVLIFAYSSTPEQSPKGLELDWKQRARLPMHSRGCEARDSYATLYRFLYWFWEKNRLFCSLLLQLRKESQKKKRLVRDTLRRSIAEVKGSNFWVCAWNPPMVWSFKWEPLSSSFLWYCLLCCTSLNFSGFLFAYANVVSNWNCDDFLSRKVHYVEVISDKLVIRTGDQPTSC